MKLDAEQNHVLSVTISGKESWIWSTLGYGAFIYDVIFCIKFPPSCYIFHECVWQRGENWEQFLLSLPDFKLKLAKQEY